MKRKSLFIVLTLMALLFISTISFANNNIKNDIHSVTDSFIDGTEQLGNDVKNGMQQTSDDIENGVSNLGNTISNGIEHMDNYMSDEMQNTTDAMYNNYTATRTTATDINNTDIMNSNLWTWVTIAIGGAIIVGLVWYYAVQNDTEK